MFGSLWSDEQERPLAHLRVIDLTVLVPGPFMTRLLAQYGADVVKVEALPHGDPLRQMSNTGAFDLLNQGKRSVGVDLKRQEGRDFVRQLAGDADIFVESFREGVMESLGLGYAAISEANPDILYVSLRGFSGKNGSRAGHDPNFIATSGCGEWFLEGGNNQSTQFAELVGGAFLPAMKLLTHLANPSRRGMQLVATMEEGFRALYLPRAFDQHRGETTPAGKRKNWGMHERTDGARPHTRYYRCRDGQWMSLGASQRKHWDTFCEIVDRVAWKERHEDPKLVPELVKLFEDAPATYWEALAEQREACLFRVVPWKEHVAASQAGSQLSADAFSWAGFQANSSLAPTPTLGRDTYSVATSVGVGNKELAQLLSHGILRADGKPNS